MLPSIERTEPDRTLIVPRVAARGRLRFLLPWLVFGAVAIAVITGTTWWSVTLRTSEAVRATPDAAGIDTGGQATAPSAVAVPTPEVAALPTPTADPIEETTPAARRRSAAAVVPSPVVGRTATPPTGISADLISAPPSRCADPDGCAGELTVSAADGPGLRARERTTSTAATTTVARSATR